LLAVVAVGAGCSSSTDAAHDPSTITYISGGNQTVTVNASGLTDLPQLVMVRVDSVGIPLAGHDVSVSVHMSGAPGPNGPQTFITGADGIAAMQLLVSNIPGPVSVRASYTKCLRLGLFGCEKYGEVASVSVPGIVAQ